MTKPSVIFTILLVCAASALPARPGDLQFNRDIRPILSENCFACHGPDPAARKKGLRLDQKEGLFRKTENGVAVVAGKPTESDLYQRIATDDEDDLMPPPKSHKKLTAQQKETIKRWIEQGAPWQPHWSLIAPEKAPLPEVKDKAWPKNAIDYFVLAKLEANGLKPAPEADRRTLARRLALDLTGLPPDPAGVDAFVADRSADAYEKLVDKYLASPQYGEHRARYWLDAARYADTHGLHFDNYREIWPYRDWVIAAFNRNMPFDQFTIEQLAGDLLPQPPGPDGEQIELNRQIATGFIRCQLSTNEGGTIPEENLVLYTRDRTETAARVWLGLTMNCCVCHDHKFDPVTSRDFYSMSAFFNNAAMDAMDGNVKDTPPAVIVPRAEDRARWAALTMEQSSLKKQLAERRSAVRPAFDRWLDGAAAEQVAAAIPSEGLRFYAPLSEGQSNKLHCMADGEPKEVPLLEGAAWQPGRVADKALQVGPKSAAAEIADAGDFDRNQPFTASLWIKLPKPNVTGAAIARMDNANGYRGWDLWIEGGRVGTHIIQHWEEDALKVVSDKPLDAAKWHHVAMAYDGTGKAAGVKIYVDGELQKSRVMNDRLKGTIRTNVPLKIGQRNTQDLIPGLLVQDLRLYGRALPSADVRQLNSSTRLAGVLAKPVAKRTDADRNDAFEWWLANLDEPSQKLTAQAARVEDELNAIKLRGAETLVMAEKPTPPTAFVLYRGEYDKRRDQVSPATPAVLPAFPADAPRNRLGFARWLVDPKHPLTARVTVNRLWQEIFGVGIVKTTEDFGITGESPSHPELLDWLAVDFRDNGWDVKRTIKLIVTSAAYRQAAINTPEKLEKDPANRLLSRGPRFRMDAEMIRDSALAASGLLVPKIGGPSVKPYQPEGVWEAVAMPESNTHFYKRDSGENLYRRSLYTFWKRAAPPASMDVFNAPTRETCTVRRERTDTPLQALVTMNDTQFVEAARVLAERALKSPAESPEARINFMAQRLLARPLRPDEMAVTAAALVDLSKHYKEHADEAGQLLAVGDMKRDESIDAATHAAWTMLANQLMNLDEFLNK